MYKTSCTGRHLLTCAFKKSSSAHKLSLASSCHPSSQQFHTRNNYIRSSSSQTFEPSSIRGSFDQELITETLFERFEKRVVEMGDSHALLQVCGNEHNNKRDQRLTWREVYDQSLHLANSLHRLGYKKNDRIGIWMPNSHEWVIVLMAASKLGLIVVNVNPAYRKHELQHALNLVQCKGLIVVPEFKGTNYVRMLYDLCPGLEKQSSHPALNLDASNAVPTVESEALPHLRHIFYCSPLSADLTSEKHYNGMINFVDLLNVPLPRNFSQQSWTKVKHSCHDTLNIQFTSGTTGLPKAAALTHYNIINNSYFVGQGMNLQTGQDKLALCVPFYHCFGSNLGFLAFMLHGCGIVLPSFGFDAEAALKAVHNHKCTALHGVPTMFIAELEHPNFKNYDLSSLRTGIVAGSLCPMPLMKRCINEMHLTQLTNCYGMTETSPVSFQTHIDDSLEVRTTSVGRIHPHVEARVVDPETGAIVPFGTQGELHVRGYLVMKYYWDQPDATRKVIDKDGWMKTGDIAVFRKDEKGPYCSIEGRIKDIIIRGGENIVPREIENFLYLHPAIKDVAIVGVPDAKYGEQICACIILKRGQSLTQEELNDYCHNQIAHYKIPKYVMFMDEFPLTVTGKIQKFVLRDWAAEKLGLKKE
ncbi:hypothetical protein C9374_007079 [Naegleria lovaniensis]|uniref:Uncharacterized protein n=1 Tax=Naegleria lovaniensis TaxID=51637 RepID=A0AA88KPT9_NAELO|nr:uncharacterized protein C9374_007079 [Naegleria lovaniensis]KAG2393548.1 hypothetical protein C9374_007079 [Naegleria lovaniensis]